MFSSSLTDVIFLLLHYVWNATCPLLVFSVIYQDILSAHDYDDPIYVSCFPFPSFSATCQCWNKMIIFLNTKYIFFTSKRISMIIKVIKYKHVLFPSNEK